MDEEVKRVDKQSPPESNLTESLDGGAAADPFSKESVSLTGKSPCFGSITEDGVIIETEIVDQSPPPLMPNVTNGDKLRDFIVDMATVEEGGMEDNAEVVKKDEMGSLCATNLLNPTSTQQLSLTAESSLITTQS